MPRMIEVDGEQVDADAPYPYPGKFEGERWAVAAAYQAYLEGACDSFYDGDTLITVSEIAGEDVAIIEDDQGFVSEVDVPREA